jgi:hypothetical protein
MVTAHKVTQLWEAASRSTTQEFLKILRSPKVHYCIYKRPPLVSILSQINPACITPFLQESRLCLGLLSCHFPSGLPNNNLYSSTFPHSCYMPYQPHPPWLDSLIILDEDYKLWSSTTLTSRTSGHRLGTFKTGDIFLDPPHCSVSHYHSISLSLFLRFSCLATISRALGHPQCIWHLTARFVHHSSKHSAPVWLIHHNGPWFVAKL